MTRTKFIILNSIKKYDYVLKFEIINTEFLSSGSHLYVITYGQNLMNYKNLIKKIRSIIVFISIIIFLFLSQINSRPLRIGLFIILVVINYVIYKITERRYQNKKYNLDSISINNLFKMQFNPTKAVKDKDEVNLHNYSHIINKSKIVNENNRIYQAGFLLTNHTKKGNIDSIVQNLTISGYKPKEISRINKIDDITATRNLLQVVLITENGTLYPLFDPKLYYETLGDNYSVRTHFNNLAIVNNINRCHGLIDNSDQYGNLIDYKSEIGFIVSEKTYKLFDKKQTYRVNQLS